MARSEAGQSLAVRGARRGVYGYFMSLAALVYLVDPLGPFFDIAVTYVLKDHLHASMADAATFRVLTAVPVYASLLFGVIRDRWSPFALGDRGHLLLFAPLTALTMLWLAVRPLTTAGLLGGVVVALVTTRFVVAAFQGLMASVARGQALWGRLSVAWQFTSFVIAIGSAVGAGLVAERFAPSTIFLTVGGIAGVIGLFALWRSPVTDPIDAGLEPRVRGALWQDLRRLSRHRPIYPAIAVMLMFQFSPAQGVVLQYYLVDTLHATQVMYGYWYAAFLAGFLPMFLLYGYCCSRVPFGRLVWWSALLAVPQMLPLAFVKTPIGAVVAALPIGMMGGLMWAAIHDLAMRACPRGLEGSLMMAVSGVNALGVRAGDLIGARLYATVGEHGFLACVLLTMVVYAAILGVVRRIPASIVGTRDGQRQESVEPLIG